MSILINNTNISTIHFVGIFGSGMSALAQFLAWQGISVSGSDRSGNNPEIASIRDCLLETGCRIHDQDGSGILPNIDAICISTAIEPDNPDIYAAQKLNILIIHRSDVLAAIMKLHKTIAVAGTSGKSTVTAMIFEFMTACGKSPSLITGAPLKRLERQSYIGNAFYGLSDFLVVEADESDGTIAKYAPYISIILNVSKDHKPIDEIMSLFKGLAARSSISYKNADDSYLNDCSTTHSFSLDGEGTWRPDRYSISPDGCTLSHQGYSYHLPLLGKHNCANCAAALAICEEVGCLPEQLQTAVASFEGVDRRFTLTHTDKGIFVINDFAHNPEKIKAAILTARMLAKRVIVIYQPHGFGPTRFLRDEYRMVFSSLLSAPDTLFLLPIYYAGGTAQKDISSEDLKNDLGSVPFPVSAPTNREDVLSELPDLADENSCILVMGARDPSLSLFVDKIIGLFQYH